MSDTLQFVVVLGEGRAAMLLESFAARRQTKGSSDQVRLRHR
jgi:hypothetical protein